MRSAVAAAAGVLVLLSVAAPAEAQSRRTTGWLALAAGGGLMIGAFDYKGDICPEGYSRHTFEYEPTLCIYYDPVTHDTDTREASIKATFKRPKLAWAGVGAIGLGAVLLTLPDNRVTRDLDVQVAPERFAVQRKFGW